MELVDAIIITPPAYVDAAYLQGRYGYSRYSLHRAVKRGEFPPPVRLTHSGRALRWILSEVEAHEAARAAARG